jgi:ketosteroid isomerase-like protein
MSASLRGLRPLVVLPLLTGACSAAPSTLTDADTRAVEAEVTAVMTELVDAKNAHDPERVVSFYSDAPDFLALTCTSYLAGGSTFKERIGPTVGARRGTTFEQQVVDVWVLSPTAAVVALEGSSSRAPALFWTRVVVKEQGRWIITYEHQSWPGCRKPPTPHPFTAPGDSEGLVG